MLVGRAAPHCGEVVVQVKLSYLLPDSAVVEYQRHQVVKLEIRVLQQDTVHSPEYKDEILRPEQEQL